MINKRATFFAIYLVFLTLLMCAMVVYLYYVQSTKLDNSFVSPRAILDAQDKQEIYNNWENQTIMSIFSSASSSADSMKDRFCTSFALDENKYFRDILEENISFSGQLVEKETLASAEAQKNFCMSVYVFSIDFNNNLRVQRTLVSKKAVLRAPETNKINFAVDFNWDYTRELVIKK